MKFSNSLNRRVFVMFSYFSPHTRLDISCKLSPMETVCIKYQSLSSGKNKKNIINLLSAKLAQRVQVKAKQAVFVFRWKGIALFTKNYRYNIQ